MEDQLVENMEIDEDTCNYSSEEDDEVNELIREIFGDEESLEEEHEEKYEDGNEMWNETRNNDPVTNGAQRLHEESLIRVFFNKEQEEGEKSRAKQPTPTETDVTIAFAEHLLGRLAPGKSYIIDYKAKKKGICKCGCNVEPKFGSTGIGHEEVWHGHIDIIFSSHNFEEDQCIANCEKDLIVQDCSTSSCTPSKKRKEDVDEKEEISPGGKTITEVKGTAVGTSEQAIAQTIVIEGAFTAFLCNTLSKYSIHLVLLLGMGAAPLSNALVDIDLVAAV
uniref:Uncharacterized protein n=1 Tax=Magallana gigas TaxID=29159 RepID=K1QHP6_MAGGI